jgi:hypothetical protein
VPHGTGVLGRVTDADGRPVPMATLTATPEPSGAGPVPQEANVTGADGDYLLPLPPGRWTVTVTAHGHRPSSTPLEVPEHGNVAHDVTLS